MFSLILDFFYSGNYIGGRAPGAPLGPNVKKILFFTLGSRAPLGAYIGGRALGVGAQRAPTGPCPEKKSRGLINTGQSWRGPEFCFSLISLARWEWAWNGIRWPDGRTDKRTWGRYFQQKTLMLELCSESYNVCTCYNPKLGKASRLKTETKSWRV